MGQDIKNITLFGQIVSFKECSKCNDIKKVEYFYNLQSSSSGKMSQCKSCHNENTRKWTESIKSNHEGELKILYGITNT